MDFIRPDEVYELPIANGVLHVSPNFDFIHHFPAIDAWILKYWNNETEPPAMANIPINKEAADFLIRKFDLEVCVRRRMGQQEFEHYAGWAATQLSGSLEDFGS